MFYYDSLALDLTPPPSANGSDPELANGSLGNEAVNPTPEVGAEANGSVWANGSEIGPSGKKLRIGP